jgi:hypothetical protein
VGVRRVALLALGDLKHPALCVHTEILLYTSVGKARIAPIMPIRHRARGDATLSSWRGT